MPCIMQSWDEFIMWVRAEHATHCSEIIHFKIYAPPAEWLKAQLNVPWVLPKYVITHFWVILDSLKRDYMPTGQQQRIHSRPTNMEGVYSNFNGRMCDCCSLIQILQSTLARFYDERMCPLHWTTATFSEQDDWSRANHLSHVWFFCNLALAEDNIMLSV